MLEPPVNEVHDVIARVQRIRPDSAGDQRMLVDESDWYVAVGWPDRDAWIVASAMARRRPAPKVKAIVEHRGARVQPSGEAFTRQPTGAVAY